MNQISINEELLGVLHQHQIRCATCVDILSGDFIITMRKKRKYGSHSNFYQLRQIITIAEYLEWPYGNDYMEFIITNMIEKINKEVNNE